MLGFAACVHFDLPCMNKGKRILSLTSQDTSSEETSCAGLPAFSSQTGCGFLKITKASRVQSNLFLLIDNVYIQIPIKPFGFARDAVPCLPSELSVVIFLEFGLTQLHLHIWSRKEDILNTFKQSLSLGSEMCKHLASQMGAITTPLLFS